jgi:hypothetical protein
MAGNPQIPQGTLNRIRGSVLIPAFPALNITAPFLGPDGISLRFDGPTAIQLPTMTGTVQSPEPYQLVHCRMHLLKTQGLSNTYKTKIETDTNIGDFSVVPDTTTLSAYQLTNGFISNVEDLSFNGTVTGFIVSLTGYYNINSSLYL